MSTPLGAIDNECPCCDSPVTLYVHDEPGRLLGIFEGRCWNCDAVLEYDVDGVLDKVRVVKRGVA